MDLWLYTFTGTFVLRNRIVEYKEIKIIFDHYSCRQIRIDPKVIHYKHIIFTVSCCKERIKLKSPFVTDIEKKKLLLSGKFASELIE